MKTVYKIKDREKLFELLTTLVSKEELEECKRSQEIKLSDVIVYDYTTIHLSVIFSQFVNNLMPACGIENDELKKMSDDISEKVSRSKKFIKTHNIAYCIIRALSDECWECDLFDYIEIIYDDVDKETKQKIEELVDIH